MKIRTAETVCVTREFHFDMAHALENHEGKCKHIHGHTYHLAVTVKGIPELKPGRSTTGMIIDFAELKTIVKACVLDEFDHALVLQQGSLYESHLRELSHEKILFVPYPPTCEQLVLDFAHRIQEQLDAPLALYRLRLRETPTSYAEWFAEDSPTLA